MPSRFFETNSDEWHYRYYYSGYIELCYHKYNTAENVVIPDKIGAVPVTGFCENIVTFSFNHDYSPQTGNTAYYDSYLAYLANACTPETITPSEPKHVRTEGDQLLWDAAEDHIGVAYYLVTQNDKPFCRIESTQTCSCSAPQGYRYAVIAVDGAGNRSDHAAAV